LRVRQGAIGEHRKSKEEKGRAVCEGVNVVKQKKTGTAKQ